MGSCGQPIGMVYGNPMGSGMSPQMPVGYPMFPQMPMGYQWMMEPQSSCLGSTVLQDARGTGCGGSNIPCAPQRTDVPMQARERKPRPPSSNVSKRRIGVNATSCTTLATPFVTVPEVGEDTNQDKDTIPDHERFDIFTLAFGTKPGTNKPATMLVTLKSPKVLAARLTTNSVGTQVGYRDLGLADPNEKIDDHVRAERKSVQSRKRQSAKSGKSRKTAKGGNKKAGNKK